MPKDDLVYIGHMLDMAQGALDSIQDVNRAAFDREENLRLALAHRIQIIGEAARRVSPEFQQAHPEVPWRAIIGMRHRVVHDYLHVDYDIVWEVVTLHLQSLVAELQKLLPAETA